MIIINFISSFRSFVRSFRSFVRSLVRSLVRTFSRSFILSLRIGEGYLKFSSILPPGAVVLDVVVVRFTSSPPHPFIYLLLHILFLKAGIPDGPPRPQPEP